MTIRRIAEDAYFVPSYSDSTLVHFQFEGTIQGISVGDSEPDGIAEIGEVPLEQEQEPFSEQDFDHAVRRVIRRP